MKRKKRLNPFSPIIERSYMVSLNNSTELLAVLRRYGRIFSRILFQPSQVSSRLQLITKFGNMLLRLKKHHGSTFVVKYLKACNVALLRFLGGKPLKTMRELEPDLPLPGLTHLGLPKFIPARDRRELSKLTVSVVRWYLTFFSVYRILSCTPKVKLSTITQPFTGNKEKLEYISQWLEDFTSKFLMKITQVPALRASLGLERVQKASPTHSVSWKGFLNDVLKWEGKSQFYNYACWAGQMPLYYDWFMILKYLKSIKWAFPVAGVKGQSSLGQLAFKEEAAGKVRVFAMVDVWTQSLLKPLHDTLFHMFKSLPNDSTHNQDAGFLRAKDKAIKHGHAFCYDLSAATDRLPIQLQIAVLNSLFGSKSPKEDTTATSFGQAWADLLCDRDYIIPKNPYGLEELPIRYAVGQPMGALSSWAMLNLTHHMIIQMIAFEKSKKITWNEDYEVLGDDIVIYDPEIASRYFDIMENDLGVSCNVSKSLLAPGRPVVEFAKRVSIGPEEVSALSWRQFRSLDSLMGRASIAFDLLTRKVSRHPLRVLKALTGAKWNNVDSYLYTLVFLASNIVKRGQLPLDDLCNLLIDPKNPFRFIGGRIIGNIRRGAFEDIFLHFIQGKPLSKIKFDAEGLKYFTRLFEAFSRGYLIDKIKDIRLEMNKLDLNKVYAEIASLLGIEALDIIENSFYWKNYRKPLRDLGDFEGSPISELLEIHKEVLQFRRDRLFYKEKINRKGNKFDNSLSILEFLEKSKKHGVVAIEIKR